MTASLSNHGPSAHPADSFDERIRGLSHQDLADRLQWLSWYQPGIFTAVMDYMDFCDTIAADTDPVSSRLDPDDPGCGEEPVPVCGRCGAGIGTFIKFGLEYRHYREGARPSARRRTSIRAMPPSWSGVPPPERNSRNHKGSVRRPASTPGGAPH